MITAQLKHALDFVARQGRKLFGSPRQDAPAGSIETLALDLLSERGEATSMARADAIVRLYASLSKEQRELFHLFLALNLLPETTRLKAAAKAYLSAPTPETVAELALASEVAAPGADPADECGARRDAFAGADARGGACGARQAAAVETVRTRHAPHARVVVQPRLPDAQADRLEQLGGRAREGHRL